MTIDEALKQLTFNKKKTSTIIKEVGRPNKSSSRCMNILVACFVQVSTRDSEGVYSKCLHYSFVCFSCNNIGGDV